MEGQKTEDKGWASPHSGWRAAFGVASPHSGWQPSFGVAGLWARKSQRASAPANAWRHTYCNPNNGR